jgi:CRISPR-associated Csh1 family protein
MSLVDRSGAKDCVEIVFSESNYSFIGCYISANKGEDKYLYHKEPSGKPGLFLSWTIPAPDIKLFQELSRKGSRSTEEQRKLVKFWENKFQWFSSPNRGGWSSKNKLINDRKLINTLDENSQSLLLNMCKSYARSSGRICKEAEKQMRDYEFSHEKGSRANKLLVTIAFKSGAQVKYPADFEAFKKLFVRAVAGDISGQEKLTCSVCSVCNSELSGAVHIPVPVEFITFDQLVYVPNGDSRNKGKALALCQTCSERLRAGQAFINSALSFKILRSKLSFWLVPVIPELEDGGQYLVDLAGANKPLYLSNLRNMCNGLNIFADSVHGVKERSKLEAWLAFTSIFCFKDTTGHTRITGTAEGIYPSRLREIAEASKAVQRRYPYLQVEPKVMFSFPLLSEFFEGEITLTQIMEGLFLKNLVNSSRALSLVAEKVRSDGLTRLRAKKIPLNRRLKKFVNTALNALIVIEYLLETGVLKLRGTPAMSLMENGLKDAYVEEIKKFISSHEYLDRDHTTRSVFLTGVAVGILLEIQMKEFGSYPFWKHLNRLELDLPRIVAFYPQVKAKLIQYSKGKGAGQITVLRPMIEYIGANLDFQGEEHHDDRESIDLAFAVGLSEGYLIYHRVGGMRQ